MKALPQKDASERTICLTFSKIHIGNWGKRRLFITGKHGFSLLISLCLLGLAHGQVKISDIIANKPYVINLHPTDTGKLVLLLPMPFASSQFKPEAYQIKLPPASEVHAIHLVYTRYKQVDTFNQPKLNQRRLNNLKTLWPDVFKQNDIVWRVFEQKSPKTLEAAENCYHGFVIYLKNHPPKAETEKEIAKIDRVIKSYKDSQLLIPETVTYRVRRRQEETGYYLPNNPDKRKKISNTAVAASGFVRKNTAW